MTIKKIKKIVKFGGHKKSSIPKLCVNKKNFYICALYSDKKKIIQAYSFANK